MIELSSLWKILIGIDWTFTSAEIYWIVLTKQCLLCICIVWNWLNSLVCENLLISIDSIVSCENILIGIDWTFTSGEIYWIVLFELSLLLIYIELYWMKCFWWQYLLTVLFDIAYQINIIGKNDWFLFFKISISIIDWCILKKIFDADLLNWIDWIKKVSIAHPYLYPMSFEPRHEKLFSI